MSQGARSNASTAVGELAEGETLQHVFSDRRRTGGNREYLCRVRESGEALWLKAADVSGECLTVWETGEAARIDKRDYDRSKNTRKQKRDSEASTLVQTFRDSAPGKILLSQKITTRSDAGPNRKSDCTNAQGHMRADNFKLYTIRSSDEKRAEADAVKAGKEIGAKAKQYDYIGKHAFSMNGFKMGGAIPPQPTFARMIRYEGDPPEDHKLGATYYVAEVDEVVPLGIAVCTHEASAPADVLDVLERHDIEERNKRPGYLRQHAGGKGAALTKRPKSDVMLLIYGARYKPDAYRAKIQRIQTRREESSGPKASRDKKQAKPKGGSSAADAMRGLFGM